MDVKWTRLSYYFHIFKASCKWRYWLDNKLFCNMNLGWGVFWYPKMLRHSVKNRRGACWPMKNALRGAYPPIMSAIICINIKYMHISPHHIALKEDSLCTSWTFPMEEIMRNEGTQEVPKTLGPLCSTLEKAFERVFFLPLGIACFICRRHAFKCLDLLCNHSICGSVYCH